jgi:preprotein translocase subunit SecG
MVNKKPKFDKDLVPTTAVESTESAADAGASDWWADSEAAQ